MLGLRFWKKSNRGSSAIASGESDGPLPDAHQLEDALCALNYIMDDNVVKAESELARGKSCYHQLGRGLTVVLMTNLEFEQEVMHKATDLLAEAETLSAHALLRSRRESSATRSSIYPAGSEFALCNAQAKLAIAVIAVTNLNLTDCIKAFYKLRKAYVTLESIIEAENAFMKKAGNSKGANGVSGDYREIAGNGSSVNISFKEADAFSNASGSSEEAGDEDVAKKALEVSNNSTDDLKPSKPLTSLQHHPKSSVFATGRDVYTHSGANFCFGLMQLGLSMVPSAFKHPLRIIGFRGDRTSGLAMLWQASRFVNIQGALAGLVLLAYYNASRVVCDILDVEAYPKEKCEALVVQMTARYPNSRLWMLEQARIAVSNCELEQAIQLLSPPTPSPMKQLEALIMLEKALYAMFLHDYEMCSDCFIASVFVNKYSKSLYYYVAGAAQVELYRRTRTTRPTLAEKYKSQAKEWLKASVAGADKMHLLSQQLPFDAFVQRKIKKWQKRADKLNLDFVDAIGVSPIEEIIYVYGGYKRMKKAQLDDSLAALAWSENSPGWANEALDERAIHALLKSAVCRTAGDTAQARKLLTEEILKHEPRLFKGHLRDEWTCPCAHYEMAIICWMEKGDSGGSAGAAGKVAECEEWLDKVSKWGKFDLDARIALKVSITQDILREYKARPAIL